MTEQPERADSSAVYSETSWTMIEGAARGQDTARAAFSERFLPVVRNFLGARWRGSPLLESIDDAVQEVFVDCFKEGGVLDRADRDKGSFRGFFTKVVLNVARRVETRRARELEKRGAGSFHASRQPDAAPSPSAQLDDAWARTIMVQTASLMAEQCRAKGGRVGRRLELLRLRFQERMPIRDIASRWDVPAREVHKDYEHARTMFRGVLREVVASHYCCPAGEVDRECERLIDLMA